MVRTGPFVFQLYFAVGGIDVVELFFSALAQIAFCLGVEVFLQVDDTSCASQKKAQGVEGGISVARRRFAAEELPEQFGFDELQAAEVEVVAQASLLVVDDRVRAALSLFLLVAVGIDHGGVVVDGHVEHAWEAAVAGAQGGGAQVEGCVGSFALLCHGAQEFCAGQCIDRQGDAFLAGEGELCFLVVHQYIYMCDGGVGHQALRQTELFVVGLCGQKQVYFGRHGYSSLGFEAWTMSISPVKKPINPPHRALPSLFIRWYRHLAVITMPMRV